MTPEELLSRMHRAERAASSFNKLRAGQIMAAIEAEVSRMRFALENFDTLWPEFSTSAASIRGYAFLCFEICHDYCDREIRRTTSSKPSSPLRLKPTLNDLETLL